MNHLQEYFCSTHPLTTRLHGERERETWEKWQREMRNLISNNPNQDNTIRHSFIFFCCRSCLCDASTSFPLFYSSLHSPHTLHILFIGLRLFHFIWYPPHFWSLSKEWIFVERIVSRRYWQKILVCLFLVRFFFVNWMWSMDTTLKCSRVCVNLILFIGAGVAFYSIMYTINIISRSRFFLVFTSSKLNRKQRFFSALSPFG